MVQYQGNCFGRPTSTSAPSDSSGFTLKDTFVHRCSNVRRNSSNLEVGWKGDRGGKQTANECYCDRNPACSAAADPEEPCLHGGDDVSMWTKD